MIAEALFERLRQSRLLDEEQLRRARRLGGQSPALLAAALVADGTLTAFQAQQITHGDPRRLVLGQYRLLDELGRGGMGSVYKALHTIMGRVVAVKVILPELVQSRVAVEWFRREVRALTQLSHPNIVMAYDANEADGLHFLVMEHVEGTTLEALVRRQGALPVSYACELVRQAALALQYAHEKGMVHRDIKPGNLLIPRVDAESAAPLALVKVVDFGLARLQSAARAETIQFKNQAGFLGTPDYTSPEQSRDIHSVDIRSDLYSLGCTFYFALTGRVPFPADTAMEKLLKHLMEEPTPVEAVRPEVPVEVAQIVRRLMTKKPEDRFGCPAELAQALAGWASAAPVALPTGASNDQTAGEPVSDALVTNVLERPAVFALGPDDGLRRIDCEQPIIRPMPAAQTTSHADTEVCIEGEDGAKGTPAPTPPPTLSPTVLPASVRASAAGPLPDLAKLWREWAATVEAMVTRRGLHRLDNEKYRALHTRLVEACKAHAAANPRRAEWFKRLEALARPWLSLAVLRQTDPTMLCQLLTQCKQAESELCGGRSVVSGRVGLLLLILFVTPTAVVLWFTTTGSRFLASLADTGNATALKAWLRSFSQTMQAHPSFWLFGFLPAVLALSIFWVIRAPRT